MSPLLLPRSLLSSPLPIRPPPTALVIPFITLGLLVPPPAAFIASRFSTPYLLTAPTDITNSPSVSIAGTLSTPFLPDTFPLKTVSFLIFPLDDVANLLFNLLAYPPPANPEDLGLLLAYPPPENP